MPRNPIGPDLWSSDPKKAAYQLSETLKQLIDRGLIRKEIPATRADVTRYGLTVAGMNHLAFGSPITKGEGDSGEFVA